MGFGKVLKDAAVEAEVEAEERVQQERSRRRHGLRDTRRMLEEDELMRKVARGAAPPPPMERAPMLSPIPVSRRSQRMVRW